MIQVTHITPCFNHYSITTKHLMSLMQNTDVTESELIIVDDGSTDETRFIPEFLGRFLSSPLQDRWTYVKHADNQGMAPTYNDGIKLARGLYICLWNNDMFPHKGWLPPLLEVLQAPEYMVVSPMIIGSDLMSYEEFIEADQAKLTEAAGLCNDGDIIEWGNTAPWLFKRELFDAIGFFDEEFKYAQYEDWDLVLRLAQAGYKTGICTKSWIYHIGSVTQKGALKERRGEEHVAENQAKFKAKWGTIYMQDLAKKLYYEKTGREE